MSFYVNEGPSQIIFWSCAFASLISFLFRRFPWNSNWFKGLSLSWEWYTTRAEWNAQKNDKRSTSTTNIVPWGDGSSSSSSSSDARYSLCICVFSVGVVVVALSIDFLFFAQWKAGTTLNPRRRRGTFYHRHRRNRTSSRCSLSLSRIEYEASDAFFMLAIVWMYASLHRTQNECDDWKQMSNGKSLWGITETKKHRIKSERHY